MMDALDFATLKAKQRATRDGLPGDHEPARPPGDQLDRACRSLRR